MEASSLVNFFYILAAILFILGIKMLGSADTARRGNGLSAIVIRPFVGNKPGTYIQCQSNSFKKGCIPY